MTKSNLVENYAGMQYVPKILYLLMIENVIRNEV